MNCEIRKIQENELTLCAKIIREGFASVANEFGLTKNNCPSNGAFIQTQKLADDFKKGNQMFGLVLNGEMIGFMQLERKSIEEYELKKLTVIPQYRDLGYGKRMLCFAKKKVKDLGGKQITLGIIDANAVLKKWYIENGFFQTETKEYPHLPFVVGVMQAYC